jgi:hypothetical protein
MPALNPRAVFVPNSFVKIDLREKMIFNWLQSNGIKLEGEPIDESAVMQDY